YAGAGGETRLYGSVVVETTSFVFFFQAEDGIRDFHVTGVQTCALPIFDVVEVDPPPGHGTVVTRIDRPVVRSDVARLPLLLRVEIGRASCRERGEVSVGAGALTRRGACVRVS